jgi:hypothetical protein
MGVVMFPWGHGGRSRKLITHIYLVPRLTMHRDLPLHPLHAFAVVKNLYESWAVCVNGTELAVWISQSVWRLKFGV